MKNLALEARCQFAMFNVLIDIDPISAELNFAKAATLASRYGATGSEMSAFLMGEPDLESAFAAGRAKHVERTEKEAAARADKRNEDWLEAFQSFADQAARTCASSHDLYVEKFSFLVDLAIQHQTLERQLQLLEIAKTMDYASRSEIEETRRWNDDNGYCKHGIELGCCPAGCE